MRTPSPMPLGSDGTTAEDSGKDILLLAFGNPGRLDDGLGPEAAKRMSTSPPAGVSIHSTYQLMPEDAAEIEKHRLVLFVDAAVKGPEPFWVQRVQPSRAGQFSSHALAPSALMALARDALGAQTEAFVLGIRGYEFDSFGEGLSAGATANLEATMSFLGDLLARGATHALQLLQDMATDPAHAEGALPT